MLQRFAVEFKSYVHFTHMLLKTLQPSCLSFADQDFYSYNYDGFQKCYYLVVTLYSTRVQFVCLKRNEDKSKTISVSPMFQTEFGIKHNLFIHNE